MGISFNEYQEKCGEFADYPNRGMNAVYPALGMAGEAGEGADKIKKIWRNRGTMRAVDYTSEERWEIAKELGDVLWYVSQLAYEIGYELETVAQVNIEKLLDRKARGVVKSEGDNR